MKFRNVAGLGVGTIILGFLIAATVNLLLLGGAIWTVVYVLRALGVIK